MSSSVTVTTRPLGIAPDGSAAESFLVKNDVLQLELLSYGARVTSLVVSDGNGDQVDIALGYTALEPYLSDKAFLGCTVGRFAGRIGYGRFTLGGQDFNLDRNDGDHTLHGGSGSLAHRNWQGRVLPDGVEFTMVSQDGDQGFPGTLSVTARYHLSGSTITMEYEATTDKDTVVNLTNHAYFNLAGEGSASVLDHEVQIFADAFTTIDATAIPLDGNQPVAGTPFDFTEPHTIGERIHEPDQQLINGKGYDHNFMLRGTDSGLRPAAVVTYPPTGRKLEISTTEPGIQFYTGNYLDGSTVGRSGSPYVWRSAFCLETQHFPDSPNQPEFPSTVLGPGEVFRSTTVWVVG